MTRALTTTLLLLLLSFRLEATEYPQVRFHTSVGSFVVQLDDNRAPLSVSNFLEYVNEGFYEETIFHRVVDGFVIQGGGYTTDLTARPTREPIPNEAGNGLGNRRGTIGMARVNAPHSATSQFYINLADNALLDPLPSRWGYAVFGEVIEGMNVVDEIGHRATTTREEFGEIPVVPVIIERAEVLGERISR